MPHRLISLLIPPTCWTCHGPSPDGAPLCGPCRRAVPWLLSPRCPACALPHPAAVEHRCPAERQAFDAAWSVVAYEDVAAAAVRALKDRAARPLAAVMAAQLAADVPPALLRGGAVVPVPAHPWRRRRRGFDAADLIAAEFAARTGRPMRRDVLRRRVGRGGAQRGSSRAVRLAAGRIAIEARGHPPPAVVLVDDVHTTGATLHACAVALRIAGCGRVVAVTWARAL